MGIGTRALVPVDQALWCGFRSRQTRNSLLLEFVVPFLFFLAAFVIKLSLPEFLLCGKPSNCLPGLLTHQVRMAFSSIVSPL